MYIKIDDDAADELVVEVLKSARDRMEEDYREERAIFSTDPKEDRKIIRKHLKAFDRIISYFSPVV